MMRVGLAALLIAAAAAASFSFSGPVAAGDEPIRQETLSGGATLISQRTPANRTFGISLVLRGGWAEDAPRQQGLTEVLARMVLRGSLTRTGDSQALEVESAGASLGVAGGVLGISLRASGPIPAFDQTLDVLLDAAAHPRFDPADLAGEITLARQRLRASLDVPSAARDRVALRLMFPDHPLGRVADPEDDLESIDIEAVRSAHASRFRADRLILVVVGDLDIAKVRGSVENWLEGVPPGAVAGIEPDAVLPTPRPLDAPARARARRRTTQPELLVAMPTPGIRPVDEAAMDLLVHILTGPEERLAHEIRQERGWAYWLAPMDWRYPGAGAFGVLTAVPKKHLGETAGIIARELERMASEPPAVEEVERARRYLLSELARTWQRPSGRAEAFAAAAIRGRKPLSYEAAAGQYAGVTAEQIRDLAAGLRAWSSPAIVTLY